MARGPHRDNDWHCAGAYTDLRLVYISVVPLATMTQAPVRCWISAHCQRAPVTIEVNRWPRCRMARGPHRDNDWRCAGAYTDLRLVYISVVPLA
ncbi:hypothetical protein BZJ21_09175 [Salinivibrio costicola subsp. alcaliphilus]|uniref:Phytanoyl-CoA dioxygenase family protein n=1 Tax=Salinivibrio costicola subsp. alcaliphilus TaxID=272773 RepID=A0ABX3KQI1_SALCS|nr:hypothetical protein BZJ21_09175 [Salinivibrio costicola subsp. alcaliphilus]